MKNKSIILIILAAVMVFVPVTSVVATQALRDQLRELEDQRRVTRRQIADTQNLLAGTEHEMSEIIAEMQILDQRYVYAAERLEDIEVSLLMTQIRIAETNEDLDAARGEWDLQYESFRARLRAMYMQGPTGWLDVLFEASSISDFFMRMDIVQTIARADREMIRRIRETEERISANVETLFREQNMIYDLKFLEEATKRELQAAIDDRQVWLYGLAGNAAHLAEVIAFMEAEQDALDAQYGIVRTQYEQERERQRRAAEAAAAQRARAAWDANLARLNAFDGQFMWPIPTHGRVGSGFGMRFHPILRVDRMHTGIDVGAPTGIRLYAAADGYVRTSGWSGGYGNLVVIDHGIGPSGYSYSTWYAHNSVNRVSAGQRVYRGQHIADVGSTGMSTGPHLHFEVRRNNRAVDPMQFFE